MRALVCAGAAVALLGAAAPVSAAETPIRAVAERTNTAGWPHTLTTVEGRAIARAVLARWDDGARFGATIECTFPGGTPARPVCTVRWLGGPNAGGYAVRRFVVDVRVGPRGGWRSWRRT